MSVRAGGGGLRGEKVGGRRWGKGRGRKGKREDVRNEHEHLFICITNKFGLRIHTLWPTLFHNLGARIEFEFVQGANLFEFDLLPDERLKGRFDIIGMVVAAVVVTVMMMMVVAVGPGVVMTVLVVVVRHCS